MPKSWKLHIVRVVLEKTSIMHHHNLAKSKDEKKNPFKFLVIIKITSLSLAKFCSQDNKKKNKKTKILATIHKNIFFIIAFFTICSPVCKTCDHFCPSTMLNWKWVQKYKWSYFKTKTNMDQDECVHIRYMKSSNYISKYQKETLLSDLERWYWSQIIIAIW